MERKDEDSMMEEVTVEVVTHTAKEVFPIY